LPEDPILDSAELVFHFLRPYSKDLSIEKFWVLSLNRKNRLIRCHENTSGTATSSLVHPREVFQEAIRNNASAIIVAHNHPSGDPSPSSSDIRVTKKLNEASKAIEIELLDHIVIGKKLYSKHFPKGYYSFAENGLI
jgi:DNA repair protein RadC